MTCANGHDLSGDNLGYRTHKGYQERFCKECKRKQNREYARRMAGTGARARWTKSHLEKHPEKRERDRSRIPPHKLRAQRLLQEAVRWGRVSKPATCSDCGLPGRIHGHHDDYSKPLDVRWLCHPCHGKRHRAVEGK